MADEITGQGQETTPGTEGVGDNAQAPGAPAGAPAPTAGADQVTALQSQLAEHKSIQAGLDKRVGQLTQQLAVEQEAKATLTQQLEAFQSKGTGEAEELELLRQKATAADGVKQDLEAQLKAAQTEVARVKLVAAKFPALAPLVEAGALPQADSMEAFEAKLTQVNASLTTQSAAAAKAQFEDLARGIKPPGSPASGGTTSLDALHQDMMTALHADDMTKYNELKEQWYAAQTIPQG